LKVNDADGNPIEIAAIVVWQVADTAKAVYAVDEYVDFVQVQAESALRHVATTRPYDEPVGDGTSLRGSTDVVAAELAQEMAERVAIAGVEIVEVRIVEGAVGMVDLALSRLDEHGIVELDEERKAAIVSNLMVVLCGDQPPSPIVNTGTLYT
jgi:regulator of protease activity HflC (stomatin/prohibitin superfamily)